MQRLLIFLLALTAVALCEEVVNKKETEEEQASEQEDAEDRILGGAKVDGDDFVARYTAYIYTEDNGGCTGAVVNGSYIVTAASCLLNVRRAFITIGQTFITHDEKMKGWVVYSSKFLLHPGFNMTYLLHDVAVISLPASAKTYGSLEITRQCNTCNEDKHTYCPHMVSGYGSQAEGKNHDATLRRHTFEIAPDDHCEYEYNNRYNRCNNLCTNGGQGSACVGDAGAPLIDTRRPYHFVAIASSRGLENCKDRSAAIVYTMICAYSNWILNAIVQLSHQYYG